VSWHGTVIGFGRAFGDVEDPGSAATTIKKPDTLKPAQNSAGASVSGQLLTQSTAGLHEQGAVAALVRDLHLLIVGVGHLQPAGDLLR
jgi:hypothetical protein